MNDYRDAELRELVSGELYPDEKLLWVGKPTPLRIIRQNSDNFAALLLIAVIVVIALALYPTISTETFMIGSITLPLWILFLIPIIALLGYLAYIYRQADHTVYAITSRRALIIKPTIDGKHVRAYNIMPYIERHDLRNGKGDLIFDSQTLGVRNYRNQFPRDSYLRTRDIGFFGIANVREVERLLFNTFGKKAHTSDEH